MTIASYRIARKGVEALDAEGLVVALITRSGDRSAWRAYQQWLQDGNMPAPEVAPAAPVLPVAERVERLWVAVQMHWNATARDRGFRGMQDALLHTGFAHGMRADAVALGQWEVACRVHIQQLRADVIAGTRPVPTPAELIAELPALAIL